MPIRQAMNRVATERDAQINAVASFMAHNNIDGDLRDSIFDYFDFRYANPYVDFEKRFLDELPLEMQYRVIQKLFPKALGTSSLFKGTHDAFVSQCVIRMARRPIRTFPGQVIPPPLRTKWTCRVPHPVLIGHAASLTPY
jgi:hypothetical protein